MSITQGVRHVAYRCKDAKETVEWYQKHLNMDFVLAIAEDKVPSTGEPDPYMHIFWMQVVVISWHFLSFRPSLQWDEVKIRPYGLNI
ncbi:Glyoxalase family protein [Moraxella catarrhalis]|nr:Glyoxalase family protein [Moraxella catarrhalis]